LSCADFEALQFAQPYPVKRTVLWAVNAMVCIVRRGIYLTRFARLRGTSPTVRLFPW
jgi:hypothetical protein